MKFFSRLGATFVLLLLPLASLAATPPQYASGTLSNVTASVGIANLNTPQTCTFSVYGTFVGTVGFYSGGGSSLSVASYSTNMTSTTVPVDAVASAADFGTVSVSFISYTSGTANVSISCVEAYAYGGGIIPAGASTNAVVLNPATAQTGTITVNGNISAGVAAGGVGPDLSASRSPTAGYLYLGSNNQQTFGFNGTEFQVTGGSLNLLSLGAAFTAGSSTYGPTSATVAGIITQPGYAQHAPVFSITTPATCTALSACASGVLTFTTAMVSAAYECTANTETYPYVVEIASKTTTAVTFELYSLVAVSSAQTVPVDYDCKV